MPRSRPTIADLACELLAASPARFLTTDELVAGVVARGGTSARDPRKAVTSALDADRRFTRIDQDRWVLPLQVLDGAVLTHVLTADEAAAGALTVTPDVAPLWMLAIRGDIETPDGPLRTLIFTQATSRLGDGQERAIDGPPGWLPDRPGVLLHLRFAGSIVSVKPGPAPRPASRIAERRLAQVAHTCLDADPPRWDGARVTQVEHVLMQALLDAPDLLREPMRPLGEVFWSNGLEAEGSEVGLPGTDWSHEAWPIPDDFDGTDEELDAELERIGVRELAAGAGLGEELERLRDSYDLTDWETDATALLLASLELEPDGPAGTEEAPLRACAHLLMEPILADVLAGRAWETPGPARVAEWARRIRDAADPDERAGARYVLATALEAGERVLDAEAELRQLLVEDPRHAPGLTALAGFEEDRNADGAALALLKKARVPRDDPQRQWLEAAVGAPSRKLGRNEACACGSGRPARLCHPNGLGGGRPSPGQRLIRKIHAWAERPDVDDAIHALLEDVGLDPDEERDSDDDPWWLAHALASDILLFERGELDRALMVRGPLLPAEEKELGRSWKRSRRALLEVRAIRPDAGVTLVDVDTGRVTDISDTILPRQLPLGALLCARLLPDGAGSHIADAVFTVDGTEESVLLDLVDREDGFDLLAWVAGQGLIPWMALGTLPVPGGSGSGEGGGPRRTPGHA
ncbi:MAG: hypothetical protein U0869_26375 [Chloroflexota bacterium]